MTTDTITMSTASSSAPTARMDENLAIERVRGVSTRSTSPSMVVMRPISVSCPVPVTTPRPEPAATVVPEKAMQERSPSGASAATGRVFLSAATDSPVRADSSTRRLAVLNRRRSAGTLSPARSLTTSPGTSWSESTVIQLPSRRTSEAGESISRIAASASAAFPSCR